jgi:hypothetical protein
MKYASSISAITATVVTVLCGCLGSRDVVARAALSQEPVDAGQKQSDTMAGGGCSDEAQRVVIITTSGRIYRLQPDTGATEDLGIPDCLEYGSFSLSVDRAGSIWVLPPDGKLKVIDPVSLACRETSLALQAITMAFVYDPALRSDQLYVYAFDPVAVVETLWVVDPISLTKTLIGELETPQPQSELFEAYTRSLTGTADGQLLAIYDADPANFAIGRVDLHTARIEPVWPAVPPGYGGYFVGGVAWGDDFVLAFEGLPDNDPIAVTTRFRTATEQTWPLLSTAIDYSKVIAVGSSSCTSRL